MVTFVRAKRKLPLTFGFIQIFFSARIYLFFLSLHIRFGAIVMYEMF